MTQPWWKRALSYLKEIHIESAPSDLNPHLYVSLRQGRYQLNTANAVYSYEDKYDNFRLFFERWDFQHHPFKDVLILGFGLGSVPILLEQHGEGYSFVGVEKDPEVIYLASKYGLPRIKGKIEIIEASAEAFVAHSEGSFDLIITDIFVDDVIPEQCRSIDYLKHLKRLVSPSGLVLMNTLAYTNEDKQHSNEVFENYFLRVFESARSYDLAFNRILSSKALPE